MKPSFRQIRGPVALVLGLGTLLALIWWINGSETSEAAPYVTAFFLGSWSGWAAFKEPQTQSPPRN